MRLRGRQPSHNTRRRQWAPRVITVAAVHSVSEVAMRCLLVSDLHYTLKQFDWLLSIALPLFNAVVIAGDHLDISSTVALDAQVVVGSSSTCGVLGSRRRHLHGLARATMISTVRNPDNEKVAALDVTRASYSASRPTETRVEIGRHAVHHLSVVGRPAGVLVPSARNWRAMPNSAAVRWVWVYHGPARTIAGQLDRAESSMAITALVLNGSKQYQPGHRAHRAHSSGAVPKPGGSWVDRLGKHVGVQRRTADRSDLLPT